MVDRRTLGSSDLEVSPLSLGTMTFGASSTYMNGVTADDREAQTILAAALDAGLNLIDTANSYSQGLTETLLGTWLKGRRHDVILATKVGMVIPDDGKPGPPIQRGLAPNDIITSCEDSLSRLRTDHIDLFQLHLQDTDVPIADTLGACQRLMETGKIRYIGASNFTGVRIMEAIQVAHAHGLPEFQSVQLQYSLAVRDAEREMIPAAKLNGLGILTWSPLARGFLSGKFHRGTRPQPGSRLEKWRDSLADLETEQNFALLDMLRSIAAQRNSSVSAVALAWLLAREDISSVVVGARTISQFESNLAALSFSLSDGDKSELSAVSTPRWGYPYSFIESFAGSWQ